MLKKLMITTAITGLMVGSAFAADDAAKSSTEMKAPAPASTEMKAPAPATSTEMKAPASSTEMKTPGTSASTAAPSSATIAAPATSAKFVNSQRQDQYLASKFKGTDVIGSDDK